MADMGHFLGGAAEGLKTATDMRQAEELIGLRRDTLAADTGLRSRGLDLQERQVNLAAQAQKNAQTRQLLTEADKQVNDTLGVVNETITSGLAAGRDPAVVAKAVQPLVESAKRIAGAAGLNPGAIDVKVNAWMAAPGLAERAAAEGTAAAAKVVANKKALEASGVDTTPTWKTLDEKVKAEGALRDDYLKQAAPFIVQRDAKMRLDSIEKTGAGDVGLVFTFMKLLDPGSTVREGEFATASNAAGVPSAIMGKYNKVVGGGVLDDKARKEIKEQANKFYQTAALQHDKLSTQFASTAKRNKLDPDSVIVDLSPDARATPAVGAAGTIPPPPPGFNVIQ
jgi:hypothetical protein